MPRLGSRVRAPLSAPSHASGRFSNRPFSYRRRSGQVVRQRPAKPLPPVRIRASPPDRPRGPPKGGPLFVRGTQIRAVPAARCGGADPGRRRLRRRAPLASSTAESAGAGGRCPAAADAGAVRAAPCGSGRFSKWSKKSHLARAQGGPNGTFCSIWDSNLC